MNVICRRNDDKTVDVILPLQIKLKVKTLNSCSEKLRFFFIILKQDKSKTFVLFQMFSILSDSVVFQHFSAPDSFQVAKSSLRITLQPGLKPNRTIVDRVNSIFTAT